MSDTPPVRVHFNAPISEGVSLMLDWDATYWGLQIGQWIAAVNAFPGLLDVVDAAYVLKHEGRAEPLHNALYRLERSEAMAE